MTLLNPAILFGLLAVGLPVAIHLLSRPQLRPVKWAASRFLQASLQKNRSFLKAEDLLLLILRCLLVALLVLIFARPAFLTSAANLGLSDEAVTAVILLDNSASMGQSDGVQSRFDLAKVMAGEILSKLAPGSQCALFLVADSARGIIPKPTRDFAIIRRSLAQAPLTDRGTDLYPGLRQAVDLLKSCPAGHQEIFLLTDSQVSAWRELDRIRELQDENRKNMVMHFLPVGDLGEDNVAVSALQMIGSVAAVNQPLHCTVQISNWSRSAVEKIPVKLRTDDDAPQDEALIDRIEPGASRTVTLSARFHDPGYHSVTATIPGDRLPADNQRSLALLVLAEIQTLVIEGTANPDPVARDGFFLRHALVPVRPDEVASYYLKVAPGRPADLESTTIDKYQLIFLSNVAALTPLGAQNLRRYLEAGGAAVIFPGPVTDVGWYNSDPEFGPLLPARLGPAIDAPAAQKFLHWQSREYPHPLTALWNDPASGNLGNVRVARYFPLKVSLAAETASRVIVHYADGEPAVVERSIGKGKVVLFSSTATTAWTTLPIHPAFVPLLMRIVAFATAGPSEKINLAPGQPFAFDIGPEFAGQELSVLRPGEKTRRIAGQVEMGEHSALLRDSDTEQAGAYQLFVGDDSRPKAVFAVQGDPLESNLAQQPRSDLDALASHSVATSQSPAPAEKSATDAPRVPGRELWYPLVMAALLLALTETALAHRFSQSR